MRKNFLYVIMAITMVMGLMACEPDESISTTEIAGRWFVNRIEMITAQSLDSEDYEALNSKKYDAYNLKEGSLMFVVKETSNYNEYFVIEYKYDGTKWNNHQQETVRLSGNNKFVFNGRQCKFKKGSADLLEIKAKYANEYYRYRLEKTLLKP